VPVTTKTRSRMPCSCISRLRCTYGIETNRGIVQMPSRWVAISQLLPLTLTEINRPGNGVRFFPCPIKPFLLTHWSVASSGLRDSDNLWFDGIRGCQIYQIYDRVRTCAFIPSSRTITHKSHSQTKWTYNQGVIASGLGALYAATGNRTYLIEAEKTLDAVADHMTSRGILKERCDDATQSTCNEDQVCLTIFTRRGNHHFLTRTSFVQLIFKVRSAR